MFTNAACSLFHPGHGGSELLQHLPQPARVPAPPDLFEQWSHLKYVDLSHNRLLHVDRLFLPTDPPQAFEGMSPFIWRKHLPNSLIIFVMFHQNFASRTTTLFRTLFAASAANHRSSVHRRKHTWQCARVQRGLKNKLENPKCTLDHNNLTDLDSVLHPQMYNLDRLHLSHNLFVRVTENSFNGKVNSTRYILLDHCLIREFSVRQYIGLPLLVTLDLNYNLIDQDGVILTTDIPPPPFPLRTQQKDFSAYEFAIHSKNKIKKTHLSFRWASLDRFRITAKSDTLFTLYIQRPDKALVNGRQPDPVPEIQRLHRVDQTPVFATAGQPHRARGAQHLQVPPLCPGGPGLEQERDPVPGGCVRFLSVLTTLNLANNKIEGFEEGEFSGLNRLNHLNLHGNHITTLGGEVHRLVDLEYLTVSSNRISTLATEQIPDGLKYLNLTDNPFRCDCQLLLFLDYLDSTGNLVLDAPCVPFPATPSHPVELPPGCGCFCTHEARRHFMTVDCSSLGPTRLPTLFGGDAAEVGSFRPIFLLECRQQPGLRAPLK
ncbi:uncharacterized protein CEXT_628231 [Caerostris extrusa]|uniref:LRRCT domain-containing protein n=1 Tax=Caerostris extrusa TaxID=172846 RepID=A0AAV4VNY7_CAEEX|nr:uncharacterized protein CEXT_628231 [Caerostris extrusa]